jgi:hypothetical protein
MSVEVTGGRRISSKASAWSYGGYHRISLVSGGSRASEMMPTEYIVNQQVNLHTSLAAYPLVHGILSTPFGN